MNPRVLCVIPARGGSKRLPGKNLRLVAGKPLVVHSIEHALAAQAVTRTVVSTDDPDIAAVARAHRADVVMRPEHLASDAATSESALIHVLDRLEELERYVPDVVVFLQCTSPVRRASDIDAAVERLVSTGADSLFSATESHWLLWRRQPGRTGQLESMNYDFRARQRDQERPEEYRENGSIYVTRTWVLRQLGNRLGGRIGVFPMDYWSSFQVDVPEDLQLVDWILRERSRATARRLLDVAPALVVFDFDGVMTDNRVLVFEDGREGVLCNRADGLGIQRLVEAKIPIVVLSTEANAVVKMRCEKLGVPCIQGVRDKWLALSGYLAQRDIDPAGVVFVGNDVNDLECLRRVGLGVAVADAHQSLLAEAGLVLSSPGGYGAVREVCDILTGHAGGGARAART